MSPLQKVVLPKSGLLISRVGLGLSRAHYRPDRETESLIKAALEMGVTHFDTARGYSDGHAERILGNALQGQRTRVTIATKFGINPARLIEQSARLRKPLIGARAMLRRLGVKMEPVRDYTAGNLRNSVEDSLRALKTDYCDILFLHEPLAAYMDLLLRDDSLFETVARLKAAGKVKYFGVSTHGDACAAAIGSARAEAIDVVQMPEADWHQNGLVPDLTYSLFRGQSGYPRTLLQQALARRPQGAVVISTTRIDHLREVVA
jgi:aryl-alcohol dehydrogenase-like predicted oxidoreductase